MSTISRDLLLDTNIIIHLSRGGAIGQAIDARFGLRARTAKPLMSAVTPGELLAFARFQNWGGPRIAALSGLLHEFVVVNITTRPVLERYAEIDTFLKRNGRAVADNDVWIAACAAATSATLLTTDRDFDPLQGSYLERVWIDPRSPGA
jgi:predicted nucleic acid-binding protein